MFITACFAGACDVWRVAVGEISRAGKAAQAISPVAGQSWFPRSWTDKDIKRAGSHVTGLKGNRHAPDGAIVYGTYKGVRVGVIRTNGKIATVFPDSNQTPALNRRRRKK